MSNLYTIMVTVPFTNTYNQIDSIQIDKDYRIKNGFVFESTVEASNGRYFIENCDDAKYIGRWVPTVACKITKTEEFNDTKVLDNLPFDAEQCDVNIRLITDSCNIAEYSRSIAHEVKLFTGAVLSCDCVLYANIDANQLVRYRISDADRDELIGKWLELNSLVTIDYADDQYQESIEESEPDIEVLTEFADKYSMEYGFMAADSAKKASTSTAPTPTSSLSSYTDINKLNETLGISSTASTNGTDKGITVCYIDDVDTSKSHGYPMYVGFRQETGKNGAKIYVRVKYYYTQFGGVNQYHEMSKTSLDASDANIKSVQKMSGLFTDEQIAEGKVLHVKAAQKEQLEAAADADSSAEPFEDSSMSEEYGGGDYSTGVESLDLSGDGFNQLMKIYNLQWSNKSLMDVPLERMGFVHGLPFQFTRVADRRRGSTNQTDKYQTTDMYGMTYAREILSQLPIVVFNPGEPQFLTKLKSGFFGNYKSSTSIKDKWMPLLSAKANDNTVEGAIQQILNEGGDYDYYTMDIKTEDYFNYVNMLCKMCARNMGLDNEYTIGSSKKNPIHMNWNNYNTDIDVNCSNDSLMSVLGMNQGVAFVFDPQSSITDSITNSTTESQVAGLLNNMSATARELGFVTGTVTEGGLKLGASESVDYDEIASSYKKGWTDGNIPILDSISHYVTNISNGLNVRFPEIWSDSSQTKSYGIDMHFIAPYANPLCVWKHVLVPFWHIFALASPRSANAIVSYGSPFLIRAFSKGYFNVEMGIIESLSYKRFGDGDAISANGIPTQMDVTVEFKDMYHMLAMTPYNKGNMSLFFNNAGLIELIGTLSGINMNRLGLGERLSLYVYTKVESVRTLGSNFMQHVRDRVRGVADKFYFGM